MQKIKAETLNKEIQILEWSSLTKSTDAYVNHLTNEVEWLNHLALADKANASDDQGVMKK